MMSDSIRWTVHDRYGNAIYLSQERWEHIVAAINHPEMLEYEIELQETIRSGLRKQDALNPHKYRYTKEFFHFRSGEQAEPLPNNYIVTAYQKEIR